MRSQKWEYVPRSSAGLHLLSEIKISCKSSWVLKRGWRCCLLCCFAGAVNTGARLSFLCYTSGRGGWEVRVPALGLWDHFVSILGLVGTNPPVLDRWDNLTIKADLLVRGHPFIYGEKNRGKEKKVNFKIFISAVSRQNPSSFCFQFRFLPTPISITEKKLRLWQSSTPKYCFLLLSLFFVSKVSFGKEKSLIQVLRLFIQ